MPNDSREFSHDHRPRLFVFLLDQEPVDTILAFQRRIIYELESSGECALILCEHAPALTIGRSGSLAHLRTDDENEAFELQPRFVSRGGGCWLHMPGQVAGYLIGDLKLLADSADDYLGKLESSVIEALADFDVRAGRDPRHSGLFVGGKRIAALGLSALRNMVHYGFLLNAGPYLRPFDLIVELGFDHRTVRQTSMESVRGRPVEPSRLRSRLVERVREAFALEAGPVFMDSPDLTSLPEIFETHVCR
jgi:lipoyl(octanoyl) transferase